MPGLAINLRAARKMPTLILRFVALRSVLRSAVSKFSSFFPLNRSSSEDHFVHPYRI